MAATGGCVLIGTLAEMDGETTIRLVHGATPTNCPGMLAFEGRLTLPSRHFVVQNVQRHVYVERTLESDAVTVQIWVNHHNEPDLICIVVN